MYSVRDRNVISGIIMCGLISFIAYLITLGTSLFFLGDIHFLIGVIVAAIFSLNNMKPHQHSLRIGLIVGILGSLLSAFAISLLEWIYYLILNGLYLNVFFYFLLEFSITAVIIGILIGLLAGVYYMVKGKGLKEDSDDEEFFKDLIEK